MNSYINWNSHQQSQPSTRSNSQLSHNGQPSVHMNRPIRSTPSRSNIAWERERDNSIPRPLTQQSAFIHLRNPPPPPTLPTIPTHHAEHPWLNKDALKETISNITGRFRYDAPNVAKDEETQAMVSDIASALSAQSESLYYAMLTADPPLPPSASYQGSAAFPPFPSMSGFPPNTLPQASAHDHNTRRGGLAPPQADLVYSMDDDVPSLKSSINELFDPEGDCITVTYVDDGGRRVKRVFETLGQPMDYASQSLLPNQASNWAPSGVRLFSGHEQPCVQPMRRPEDMPSNYMDEQDRRVEEGSIRSSEISPANTRVRFNDPFTPASSTSSASAFANNQAQAHQAHTALSPVSREPLSRRAASEIDLLRESLSQTDDKVASISSQIEALIGIVKRLDSKLTDREETAGRFENWTGRDTRGSAYHQSSRGGASGEYRLQEEDYY
ncbi:hypothetical protein IAR50_006058 [Cryptococcus sp. DSM 104548]